MGPAWGSASLTRRGRPVEWSGGPAEYRNIEAHMENTMLDSFDVLYIG